MAKATRKDPYGNFNFLIEINGETMAGFSECSGLISEVDVIEYREGGDLRTRKLPGLAKVGDITLKRGIVSNNDLQNWHRNILNGVPDRRNISIVLLDNQRQPVVRWKVSDAWPLKWEGPFLNAKGNDVAIETLTLACEGIERE
jgi:phage tail-like protein